VRVDSNARRIRIAQAFGRSVQFFDDDAPDAVEDALTFAKQIRQAGNPIGNRDGSVDVSQNLHSIGIGQPTTRPATPRMLYRGYEVVAQGQQDRSGSGLPADESTLLGPPQKPVLDQCLENDVAHLAVETPQALDLVSRQQQPGDFEELATQCLEPSCNRRIG
jgi:hypothetical protein